MKIESFFGKETFVTLKTLSERESAQKTHRIISDPLSFVMALMRFANSGVVAKHGK